MSITPPPGLPAALDAAGLHLRGPVGRGSAGPRWSAVADDGARWTATVAPNRSVHGTAGLRGRVERLREVSHPHLAVVGELLEPPGGDLVVLTEEVPGTDLATVSAAKGYWLAGEVVTVLLPLASALAALHAVGLSHGDVSAANVVVTPDGRPVLVDLLTGAEPDERGTPRVAARDRATGARPSRDGHSLAAVGLELLCRGPGRSRRGSDPPAADPAGRLERCLADVVHGAPADRPTAAALAAALARQCPPVALDLPEPAVLARAALRRLAEATHAEQTRRVDQGRRAPRHRRSRGPRLAAAAGSLLVLGGCVAALVSGPGADEDGGPADADGGRADAATAAVQLTVDRAQALATGDLAALRAVTVPGSPAALADLRAARTALGASAVADRSLEDVTVEVLSVEVVPPTQTAARQRAGARSAGLAGPVEVVVTARVGGPRSAGTAASAAPPRSVTLVLWAAGEGWAVSDVLPAPAR